MNDEKDYIIEFDLQDKKNIVYLPYTDGYKVIAKAIRNVCTLFDNQLHIDEDIPTENKKDVKDKNVNILIVCNGAEIVEMVKYHDSYWIEPIRMDLSHILDITQATKFKDIATDVYSNLMNKISHL